MKIKGSTKKIAPNIMIIIAAVAILVTVPIRTYQLVNIIEPKTGFFLKTDVTVYLLYGLLALSCLAILVLSYICATLPRPEIPSKRNVFLGIVAIIVAGAFLCDCGFQVNNFIKILGKYELSDLKGMMYYVKSGGGAVIIQAFFAGLSVIYFILFGISNVKGAKSYEKAKLLALSPIIWGICRMIHRFIEPISFKNVSELVIQLFMIIFVLMFFLAFARISSRVNHKESSWVLYGAGLSSVILICTDTFSNLIIMLMSESSILYTKYPINVVDVFVAIFVFVLLLDLMPTKSQIKVIRDNNIELLEKTKDEN